MKYGAQSKYNSAREMIIVEQKPISALRFAVPVAIETTATTVIGLVVSAIIGGISGSSLVAASTTTQMISLLAAILCMLSTGAPVLVARFAGAKDMAKTSNAVEQSILLTGVFSTAITVLVLLFSNPLMHLLMPNAEAALFSEGVVYLRTVTVSYPFLMFYTVLAGILRATGNSRAPMYISIGMNLLQLICAFLFLRVFDWGMIGAGLSLVVCRLAAALAMLFVVIFRGSGAYHVHLPNLKKIDIDFMKTVMRVGLPSSFETLSVQVGYVVANSLTIGLGTYAASVAQVANTLNNFPCAVHTIAMAVQLPIVGQHIGAKRKDLAKKSARNIWIACVGISLAISLVIALFGDMFVRIYTKDASVAADAAWLLWTLPLYHLFGGSINSVDPALKAGGEQKFVMIQSAVGVWILRIPLMWLFGYVLGWGIRGMFFANYIALLGRAASGLIMRERGKWIHDEL